MWLDSWTLATANEAVKAGKSGFTGGLIYDPKTGGGKGNYTHAILAIELQGLGKWDWGAFTWRNVIVQARTKETAVRHEHFRPFPHFLLPENIFHKNSN